MTPIADMVERLLAAGATPEVIVIAIRGAEASAAAHAAKRRAKDAERQRRKRGLDLFEVDGDPQDIEGNQAGEHKNESRDKRDSDPEQKEVPIPLRKTTPSELSNESSEDAGASQSGRLVAAQPVYTDSKHELWGEGVPILVQLGLKDREARSNIGRWLRDSKDDAAAVLGAIQRARDHRIIDPIPWITRALQTGVGVVVNFRGQPRPGSREDRQEQTANARRQFREAAYGLEPDGPSPGDEADRPVSGGLPVPKPA